LLLAFMLVLILLVLMLLNPNVSMVWMLVLRLECGGRWPRAWGAVWQRLGALEAGGGQVGAPGRGFARNKGPRGIHGEYTIII
jgi:hypothetical protein